MFISCRDLCIQTINGKLFPVEQDYINESNESNETAIVHRERSNIGCISTGDDVVVN